MSSLRSAPGLGPIVLTNDDGIEAAGLHALARAFHERFGERIAVVAPLGERSAVGHGITLRSELMVRRFPLPGLPGVPAYGVAGTPVDCVKLAVRVLVERQPALVCSGVNHGYNLGTDVFYSGTVSAALEAAILGLPALAVSTGTGEAGCDDFHTASQLACRLACVVLQRGLPSRTLLNLNVPPVAGGCPDLADLSITRLGFRSYRNAFRKSRRSGDSDFYVLADETLEEEDEEGTDVSALMRGRVSLTPIHLDLTNHSVLASLEDWLR